MSNNCFYTLELEYFSHGFVPEHNDTQPFWIGAHDFGNNDHFVWVKWVKTPYVGLHNGQWATGEPVHSHQNHQQLNCVQMNPDPGRTWKTINCDTQLAFICQRFDINYNY